MLVWDCLQRNEFFLFYSLNFIFIIFVSKLLLLWWQTLKRQQAFVTLQTASWRLRYGYFHWHFFPLCPIQKLQSDKLSEVWLTKFSDLPGSSGQYDSTFYPVKHMTHLQMFDKSHISLETHMQSLFGFKNDVMSSSLLPASDYQ